jgi:protein TonB
MSEASSQSPAISASIPIPVTGYELKSELARMVLPSSQRDSYRKLAYVNSICLMFLIIGIIGLRAPRVNVKPLSEPTEIVPVVFTPPPEEQPKVEPDKPDEPQPQDAPTETPQVVTVVAPSSANVAFSVPVQGPVAIAPIAHFAPPPPRDLKPQASGPVKFNPHTAEGGSFPEPKYPGFAVRNHYQGTVTLEILVDESGKVSGTKIRKSSGYPTLDEAAVEVVKTKWKFPPGPNRDLVWDCTFRLQ